jgi:hypothetical protein
VGRILMGGPIIVLFIFSILVGSWFTWRFVPPSSLLLPWLVKSIILLGLIGFIVSYIGAKSVDLFKKIGGNFWALKWVSGQIWFLPYISSLNPVKILFFGKSFYRFIDNGWLEIVGGQGGVVKLIETSRMRDKWNVLRIKLSFYLILLVLVFVLMVY